MHTVFYILSFQSMFFHSVTPSFTPIKTRVNWCDDTKFKMQQILPDKKKTVLRQTDRHFFRALRNQTKKTRNRQS